MNKEAKKCKRIKALIEEATGYSDIGFDSRKRPYPEFRKIYSKLCKTFTSATYEMIGEELGGYNHSSMVHNVNTFDDLLHADNLDHKFIYESLFSFLQKEREELAYRAISKHTPREIANQMHRDNLRMIVEKTNDVIHSKNQTIENLKAIIKDISEAFNSGDTLSKEYVFELKAKINSIVLKNNL